MNKKELLEALKNQKENLAKSFLVSDEIKDGPSNIQKMYDIFSAMEKKIVGFSEETQEINNLSVMYEDVKKFTERIITDKTENESFSFNSYKYAEEIRHISENYGAEFSEVLAPIKMVKENIDKSIVFTGEQSLENVYDRLKSLNEYTMISQNNPVFRGALSESDILKMTGILSTDWTKAANSVREGALPFIYCTLLAEGYTPEKIANCEVPKEQFRKIYNKVLDIENNEKREEALDWCTEEYIKGIAIAYSETEKEMAYSERIKPEKMFGRTGGMLQTMLHIGGLNYLQDSKFIPRYEKIRDKLDIQYHGEKFDVKKAHSINFTLMNSYASHNLVPAFGTAMFSPENETTPELFVDMQMKLVAAMKCEFSTTPSFNKISSLSLKSIEGCKPLIEWLDKHNNEAGIMSFLSDNMRTGKFFSNLTINPQTGSFVMNTDIKELEKYYSDYVLNNSEKIRSEKIMGAVRADKEGVKMSKDELDRAVELNKEKRELVFELNTLLEKRLNLVNRKVKELEKDIHENRAMKTEKTRENLSELYKYLYNNNNKSDMRIKYGLLSNYEDSDFDFSKEGEETSNEDKFDSLLNRVIKLSESKDKSKTEEKSKIEEKTKNEENKTISHQEIIEKINRLNYIEKDKMYKKSMEMPKTKNTVDLIKKMYEKTMNELVELGKKNDSGEPIGNTELFNNMYKSMKEISKYGKEGPSMPGEGLNALINKANRDIEIYIENRDSFIKWTNKGRERLRICKDFIDTAKILQTQYAELSEELLAEHEYHQKAFSEKTDEISKLINEEKFEKGQTKAIGKTLEPNSLENKGVMGKQ